jgi:hypothetical protein
MSITVTDLTHHIVTLRRLHARVLEAKSSYYVALMARASWRKPCAWPTRWRGKRHRHHKSYRATSMRAQPLRPSTG